MQITPTYIKRLARTVLALLLVAGTALAAPPALAVTPDPLTCDGRSQYDRQPQLPVLR
jgi:hypothetical protein